MFFSDVKPELFQRVKEIAEYYGYTDCDERPEHRQIIFWGAFNPEFDEKTRLLVCAYNMTQQILTLEEAIG